MAERVGFEPTIPLLTGYRFSRAGPSAARPPLQYPKIIIGASRSQYNFWFELSISSNLNWAIFYSICADLLRIKASQKSSTYPRVCLRFLQILMHQDLSTYLRKKSLNLGLNKLFLKTYEIDSCFTWTRLFFLVFVPFLFNTWKQRN